MEQYGDQASPSRRRPTSLTPATIMTTYLLAGLAGLWTLDGLILLLAPQQVIGALREALKQTPSLLWWELVGIGCGALLIWSSHTLRYEALWLVVGGMMIVKGCFLILAPTTWWQPIVDWSLSREPVDYRFWGLGLCTLALLLLHALGWVGT